MTMIRSERDESIIETLIFKVRVLTLLMIADTWWPTARSRTIHATRRLKELVDAELLERADVLADPLLPLTQPLCTWHPGQPPPDSEAVGYALKSSWTAAPCQTLVYVATPKAIRQYGGRGLGGFRHRLQATHDLHVAAIYLHYLKSAPDKASAWVGEDILGKAGHRIKDPDAMLVGPDGKPYEVIEFGGRYDARRVREFHEHCERFGLRYELW